jgi:predicted nucleic-acid-binding protein
MIGIDTNILLRLWLNDDPAQNKRIDALLATHGGMPGSLLVTDVVLAEAVWTLKAAFEQDRHGQLIAIRSLLEETAFAFEDRDAVAAALTLFETGSCGFADCLIVAKHARQGCDFTATFDRGMRTLPDVKVLSPGLSS